MHPFSAALREIARIPGARYSCVADDVTGDVLAEHGRPDPDPAAAVRWGSLLRAVLRPSGELEDVMITAEGTYHLLRRVRSDSGPVLVHVSVDRAHGNLALARRALGGVRFDHTTPLAPQGGHRTGTDPARAPSRPAPPPVALPVRTPRRPLPPATDAAVRRSGTTLSAVAPPRRPVAPPLAPAPLPAAVPTSATVGPEPRVTVPEARGWSDDLYTMRRLLDALRRME